MLRPFEPGQILVVISNKSRFGEVRFHCYDIGQRVIVTRVWGYRDSETEDRIDCKELGGDEELGGPLTQTLYPEHLSLPTYPAAKKALAMKETN